MIKEATLTKGSIGKALFGLAAPMVIGFISVIGLNLVDTIYISRFGAKELAAMSLTFPVVTLLMAIARGIGTGTASLVSRMLGRKEFSKVCGTTSDSLILALLTVSLFSGVGMLSIKPFFTLLGADSTILPLIKEYMTIWYIGAVFVIVPMVGNNSLRASGNSIYPSIIMAVPALLNAVLDPFLIFGWSVFPRLGLRGAAIASVIARLIGFLLTLYFLHFRRKMLSWERPTWARLRGSWLGILRVGLPILACGLAFPVCIGIALHITAQFGSEAVAAFGLGRRILIFCFIPVISLCTAEIVFVGQNQGAQKYERIARARHYCIYFSLLWGLVVIAFFLGLAGFISPLLTENAQVSENLELFLHIVTLGVGLRGICMLTVAALNGIGKPIHASLLVLLRLLILYTPLVYLGAQMAGFAGILCGWALTDILIGTLLISARHNSLFPLPN